MPGTVQKISPFLGFYKNAEEAVKFYMSIFDDSRITNTSRYDESAAKASGQRRRTRARARRRVAE